MGCVEFDLAGHSKLPLAGRLTPQPTVPRYTDLANSIAINTTTGTVNGGGRIRSPLSLHSQQHGWCSFSWNQHPHMMAERLDSAPSNSAKSRPARSPSATPQSPTRSRSSAALSRIQLDADRRDHHCRAMSTTTRGRRLQRSSESEQRGNTDADDRPGAAGNDINHDCVDGVRRRRPVRRRLTRSCSRPSSAILWSRVAGRHVGEPQVRLFGSIDATNPAVERLDLI